MKPRAGLGKKVSSIFDGVPMPGSTPGGESRDAGGNLMRDAAMPDQGFSPSLAGKPAKQTPLRTKYGDISLHVQQQLFGVQSGSGKGRQKAAAVLCLALFIILGFLVYRNLIAPAQKNTAIAPATQQAAAPAVVSNEKLLADMWKQPEPYPDTLRDPMMTTEVGTATAIAGPVPVSMQVRGIVVSDESSAIVNGKIVKVGETVDGVTVISISPEAVEFKSKEKTWKQGVE